MLFWPKKNRKEKNQNMKNLQTIQNFFYITKKSEYKKKTLQKRRRQKWYSFSFAIKKIIVFSQSSLGHPVAESRGGSTNLIKDG